MRIMLIIVVVLGILDGIWGNGTLYRELVPFQNGFSTIYKILGFLLASLMSFFLVGTIIEHLETHVISKIIFKKKEIDDEDDDENELDIADLGDASKTTQL
ncbi:MAG: hypothetical protein U9N34_05635 [Candidatus Cloacimonadota bacterium]|nr:hypothetical protein [Candidatus Cloacimonadota bacterium]